MAITHRCMILGSWNLDKTSKLSSDYVGIELIMRAISPPGEAQPHDNIMPKPNLSAWYVEGSNADLQQIAADPDYPILQPIEEIPIDAIL